jgi:hypothetical protein
LNITIRIMVSDITNEPSKDLTRRKPKKNIKVVIYDLKILNRCANYS